MDANVATLSLTHNSLTAATIANDSQQTLEIDTPIHHQMMLYLL